MYLFIDNSDDEKIVLKLYLNNVWVQADFLTTEFQLLVAIDHFLTEKNMVLQDIKGLAVLVGKGRFTATRIAVTVANSLSLSLRVPVVGVKVFTEDVNNEISETPTGRLISAEYSGEANIGTKKKT